MSKALRVALADDGQVGASPADPRSRRRGEDPEPLQVLTAVAADAENPTAPGHRGPDADGELEGAAVAGDRPTSQDQQEPVEQDEEQHDTR